MTHFLQYYFALPGHPWYQAAIWGNVFASILWSVAGFAVGVKVREAWRTHKQRLHEHAEWQARHTKRLLEHHGVDVDPHPHHQL